MMILFSTKMSRTKIATIEDIKKIAISKEDYIALMERLADLNEELEKKSEESDVKEYEIINLKNEIKNLVILCKNYKSEIKSKEGAENALKKSLKSMEENQALVNQEIAKRQSSKYSKKSKQELEQIALDRFNQFKQTYMNDL